MSKRKMKAFACALAAALAFIPFLGGCTTSTEDNGSANQATQTEEQERNEVEGSIGQDVAYGQVMGIDGDQITVVTGELTHPADGSDGQVFTSGNGEIVFNASDVTIVDESGAAVEGRTLSADDVIIMKGTGTGEDFKPQSVEIIDVAGAGTNADDARVPQDIL